MCMVGLLGNSRCLSALDHLAHSVLPPSLCCFWCSRVFGGDSLRGSLWAAPQAPDSLVYHKSLGQKAWPLCSGSRQPGSGGPFWQTSRTFQGRLHAKARFEQFELRPGDCRALALSDIHRTDSHKLIEHRGLQPPKGDVEKRPNACQPHEASCTREPDRVLYGATGSEAPPTLSQR